MSATPNAQFHITPEWLDKLVAWARTDPTDEEKAYLRDQLNLQLESEIARLYAAPIDLSDVPITTWGLDIEPYGAPMREDVVEAWDDPDALLKDYGEGFRVYQRYFVVPASEEGE